MTYGSKSSSFLFHRIMLALVLILSLALSAEEQCNVTQIAKLLADDGLDNDQFGSSVGISGTTAIVGAIFSDSSGLNSGAAYLFDTKTGQQIAKLLPNDGAQSDQFGSSVGIDGNTAIVGLSLSNCLIV